MPPHRAHARTARSWPGVWPEFVGGPTASGPTWQAHAASAGRISPAGHQRGWRARPAAGPDGAAGAHGHGYCRTDYHCAWHDTGHQRRDRAQGSGDQGSTWARPRRSAPRRNALRSRLLGRRARRAGVAGAFCHTNDDRLTACRLTVTRSLCRAPSGLFASASTLGAHTFPFGPDGPILEVQRRCSSTVTVCVHGFWLLCSFLWLSLPP